MRRFLLFLCHTYPYPPDGGVWIRTYHVARLLAETFDVTMLCFQRAVAPEVGYGAAAPAEQPPLESFATVESFPVPQRAHPARMLWDHARSLLTRRVYTEYLHQSTPFRRRLEELLATRRFALVHVDSLDLSGYLPMLRGLPVVCVHHNVESELLARRASGERSAARRAYVAFQARRMAEVEREWSGRVALNITVSARDAEQLSRAAPSGRFTVVPNGVDTGYFTPAGDGTDGVVFCGGTNWFPNRDALDHFCADILPRLADDHSTPRVRWVGAATPSDQAAYRERFGIDLTGYVPDVRPYVHQAGCFIVPLRIGGGSRLKILDAWAMGKAVVSTSLGCEGLEAVHDDNILIADDPAAFAAAVRRVLTDAGLRRRLGERGRETALRRYSWQVIGADMIGLYRSVMPA